MCKFGPRAVDAILLERRGKSGAKSVICFLRYHQEFPFTMRLYHWIFLTVMAIPRSNLPTSKVAPKAKAKADPKPKNVPVPPPKRRVDAKAEPKSVAKKAKK